MDTKIHKTDGKYKTQNRLISFITNVLKAEIMDCIKIADVIARIIVKKYLFLFIPLTENVHNASKVSAKALRGVASLICASLTNSLVL